MRGGLVVMRHVAPLVMLLASAAAGAHGDEAPVATRPDAVTVDKAVQRALQITTITVQAGGRGVAQRAVAEVLPSPEAAWRVQAPEAGRLESVGGWPAPGQTIRAGQLLAVLRPALSERERGQREADIAGFRQKLGIAQINVDRLKLQQRTNGIGAEGNTYMEQAISEYETLRRQIELGEQSLDGRVEIRAASSGRLQRVAVAAGEVVARGQSLFELGVARPRLAARVYDAQLTRAPLDAQLLFDGQRYDLHAVGAAPALPDAGWTLWFDVDGSAPVLAPGTLVDVVLTTPAARGAEGGDVIALPRACVRGDGDDAWVWLHEAPERFVRRSVRVVARHDAVVDVRAALPDTARVALGGAALLDRYR